MIGTGVEYPLIAPSEMAFSLRWDELIKQTNKDLKSISYEIIDVKFMCGNKEGTTLDLTQNIDSY
jgi:hypothetical protein